MILGSEHFFNVEEHEQQELPGALRSLSLCAEQSNKQLFGDEAAVEIL